MAKMSAPVKHHASKQEKQKMSEIDSNISKLFDIRKRLGKGAYGIVWKALDKRTNETIAVKKIFDAFRDETDAQRTFREINFLAAFRKHPNIVELHEVYKATNNLDIYLVFEYMDSDLHNLIKKGNVLKDIHKRYIMYQLTNAINYIHSGNVIHRDLKPSNVLIDSKCRCKLADFGLARSVSSRKFRKHSKESEDSFKEPQLTDYVATRWYRAPEILVASKRYTKGIDMWSLGCILGEILRGKPLFQGTSTINQIEKIISAMPDITKRDIDAVGDGFGTVLLKQENIQEKKTSLEEMLYGSPKEGINFVKALLVLDPMGRMNSRQALEHSYIEKFRSPHEELELRTDVVTPLCDNTRLSVSDYRAKLYDVVIPTLSKKSSSSSTTENNKISSKIDSKRKLTSNTGLCISTSIPHKTYSAVSSVTNSSVTSSSVSNSSVTNSSATDSSLTSSNSSVSSSSKTNSKKSTSPVAKRKIFKTRHVRMANQTKHVQSIQSSDDSESKSNTDQYPSKYIRKTKLPIRASSKDNSTTLNTKAYYDTFGNEPRIRSKPPLPSSPVGLKKNNTLSKSSESLLRCVEVQPPDDNLDEPQLLSKSQYNQRYSLPKCDSQKKSSSSSSSASMNKSLPSTSSKNRGKKEELLCYDKRMRKLEVEIRKYKKQDLPEYTSASSTSQVTNSKDQTMGTKLKPPPPIIPSTTVQNTKKSVYMDTKPQIPVRLTQTGQMRPPPILKTQPATYSQQPSVYSHSIDSSKPSLGLARSSTLASIHPPISTSTLPLLCPVEPPSHKPNRHNLSYKSTGGSGDHIAKTSIEPIPGKVPSQSKHATPPIFHSRESLPKATHSFNYKNLPKTKHTPKRI